VASSLADIREEDTRAPESMRRVGPRDRERKNSHPEKASSEPRSKWNNLGTYKLQKALKKRKGRK